MRPDYKLWRCINELKMWDSWSFVCEGSKDVIVFRVHKRIQNKHVYINVLVLEEHVYLYRLRLAYNLTAMLWEEYRRMLVLDECNADYAAQPPVEVKGYWGN